MENPSADVVTKSEREEEVSEIITIRVIEDHEMEDGCRITLSEKNRGSWKTALPDEYSVHIYPTSDNVAAFNNLTYEKAMALYFTIFNLDI
jgi:hypothetical protein